MYMYRAVSLYIVYKFEEVCCVASIVPSVVSSCLCMYKKLCKALRIVSDLTVTYNFS